MPRVSIDARNEEARVEVLSLAHELLEGDRPEALAIKDLGLALKWGDLALAKRIQQWLADYDPKENLKHEQLREAYAWPEAVKLVDPQARGRRGGLAVLDKYGPEHFARITKGAKRRPRYSPPKETAGQPAGDAVAQIMPGKEEMDSLMTDALSA